MFVIIFIDVTSFNAIKKKYIEYLNLKFDLLFALLFSVMY